MGWTGRLPTNPLPTPLHFMVGSVTKRYDNSNLCRTYLPIASGQNLATPTDHVLPLPCVVRQSNRWLRFAEAMVRDPGERQRKHEANILPDAAMWPKTPDFRRPRESLAVRNLPLAAAVQIAHALNG